MSDFVLFAGSSHPRLAESIVRELAVPLGDCSTEQFPDGEIDVQLNESVRGRTVFVIQPTCAPVNDHVIELVAFADACRRASAGGRPHDRRP